MRRKLFSHKKRRPARKQRGIALFMVMGSLALLTVLIAELGYSTQINSRLSYNYVDNLKAYYLAKAAFKLSEVRLKAYLAVKGYTDDPANKAIKDQLPPGTLDKIWSMPLLFPLPIPKEASMGETDAIKEFEKTSSLGGSYTAAITGESSKLNINNLFVKSVPAGSSGSSGSSGASGASGASGGSGQAVDFEPLFVNTIASLLEQKKNDDREFSDIYRNVQAQDIVDAIKYYIFPDQQPSALPGFKVFKSKQGPLYSLTELHLIPGIDEEIYKLIESAFTVYTTPGINMNAINKRMLLSLIPEMTDAEADDVLRNRDDPDVGQPWKSEDDFWKAVGATSAGKSLDAIKARFSKSGVKLVPDELSFKISVQANVGQSTRRLEAFVLLDPNAAKQSQQPGQPGQNPAQPPNQPQVPVPGTGASGGSGQLDASAKKPTGVNLIYWRML